LIIGAYIPYKQIDGFTKALLERFWSLRHVSNLLRGKLCATVLTYLSPDAADNVNRSLAIELKEMERMELVGQVMIKGNIPCLTCGEGDDCEMSGLRKRYGPDATGREPERSMGASNANRSSNRPAPAINESGLKLRIDIA